MSKNFTAVGHGGARKGSGRKKLSDEQKRFNVTVKLLPGADADLDALAARANTSKGSIIEWLTLSPTAEECRKLCIAEADKYSHRQPDQIESAASEHSRAALRRKTRRLLKSASKNGPQ